MHTLRLLYECLELLTDGCLTLPRPERELLIRVRNGEFSLDEVTGLAEQLFASCRDAAGRSNLPQSVNRNAVSQLVTKCYLQSWQGEPAQIVETS